MQTFLVALVSCLWFQWITAPLIASAYELLGGMAVMATADDATVLFVGDSQAFMGTSVAHGFLRVLQAEIARVRPAVTVVGTGKRGARTREVFEVFDGRVVGPRVASVVIMAGLDDVLTPWADLDAASSDTSLPEEERRVLRYRHDLEIVMAKVREAADLARAPVAVALCSPLLLGDKVDGTNDHDALIEELAGVARQVAAQHGVTFIDLRNQLLKFLEAYNHDNAPHNVLTVDGFHLNEVGHRLVATALFQALGFDWRPLQNHPLLDMYESLPGRHVRKADAMHNDREVRAMLERSEAGEEGHEGEEEDVSQGQTRGGGGGEDAEGGPPIDPHHEEHGGEVETARRQPGDDVEEVAIEPGPYSRAQPDTADAEDEEEEEDVDEDGENGGVDAHNGPLADEDMVDIVDVEEEGADEGPFLDAAGDEMHFEFETAAAESTHEFGMLDEL